MFSVLIRFIKIRNKKKNDVFKGQRIVSQFLDTCDVGEKQSRK